ncbi:TauD/TfdA family dioxygenase [Erythrobacter arachoides]|uniref:TauD/TfdA family dioxygenase n=1 Tax=Aurantiacibacter arachoides TaxID=1850444 RepID=A0A845A0L4_9SPHN|nr:TauD/TfdA family dioxygenase [Aurantiacibacter arachoides]MXO94023.1 TauD/TfdA family dioxygenase [Aurantiacibacter arachoides]GGD44688.1 taurine dioxygenase [Aurantiacibacter arachoides]
MLQTDAILPEIGFGAVCSGLDLTRPLSPAEVRQVTGAMDRFGVTMWRGTGMTDEDHLAFSRNFGYLERTPKREEGQRTRLPYRELFDASNLDLEGEITRDPAAIEYRKGDRLWHTDSAFLTRRTSYSILLAHQVPQHGGETWFADTRAAYDDLPAETKALLEGKVGINSLWWSRKLAGADISEEEIDSRFKAEHPLVHVHRGSGRKAIFIAAHTMDVKGMDKAQGRQLIADLIAHITQPQYTFSVDWSAGDMVIWDNLCTMHRGGEYDTAGEKRDMRRTTVREGTEPHTLDMGDDPYTALFAASPQSVDINRARDAGR